MYINVYRQKPLTSGTSPITDSTTYVPTDSEDEWDEEIVIIRRRKKKEPAEEVPWIPYTNPFTPPITPYEPPVKPWVYKGPMPLVIWGNDEPCMFDGLPPGTYMISCPCPRHRVIC